jgi:hypothetical protein
MAAGGPKPSAYYVERQALTRVPATPTVPGAGGAQVRTSMQAGGQLDPGVGNATPGDGLALAGLMAVVVSLWPNPGQTLSGGGSLLCWIFNTYQQAWSRAEDLDLTFAGAALVAKTWPTLREPSRLGMLLNFATSGITASGGSGDVLLRLDGFTSVLGMAS